MNYSIPHPLALTALSDSVSIPPMPTDDPLASEPSPRKPDSEERTVFSDYGFFKKTRDPESIILNHADTQRRMHEKIEETYRPSNTERRMPPLAAAAPVQMPSVSDSTSDFFMKILLYIALPAFVVSTLLLHTQNNSLQRTNLMLSAEIQKLHEAMSTAEEQNRGLGVRIQKAEREKRDLENSLRSSGGVPFFDAEIQKYENQIRQIREEKAYLEEMLINKTKEIESLRANPPAPAGPSPEMTELSERLRQKEEEVRKLSEQNQALSAKLEKFYRIVSDKMTDINAAKSALEDTLTRARKSLDDQWRSVDLGAIVADKTAEAPAQFTSPVAASLPFTAPTPAVSRPLTTSPKVSKKEGHVLAINEDHGFVIVDLGKSDGIRGDSEFLLRQNGEEIGRLTVLEVRDGMTACNIRDLAHGRKIRINDSASLL